MPKINRDPEICRMTLIALQTGYEMPTGLADRRGSVMTVRA